MLEKLTISNHSLISHAEIDFQSGFTVITGETGSGKSIMMDALSLVLGERADGSVLKNPELKCVVEARFGQTNDRLKSLIESNDLDFDSQLILRREINPQGKSRAFVNDTPVNAGTLREIGEQLADIHSQHEHLLIGQERFRIEVLDALCENEAILRDYKGALAELKRAETALDSLQKQLVAAKAEESFLRHQADELTALPLEETDEETLANQLKQAENSEEILRVIGMVGLMLSGEENGILTGLKSAAQSLEKTGRTDSRLTSFADRLKQNLVDLQDIAAELEQVAEETVTNPEEAAKIAAILDKLYTLLQKHRVSRTGELIALRDIFLEKLNKVENSEEALKELKERCDTARESCTRLADKLSRNRKGAIGKLEKSIHGLLGRVGLEKARFAVNQESKDHFSESGTDRINYLFSANPGMELQPADKVASGGEISRLMLCLKCETARHRSVPTLILDEADTGTGGETARKIGILLAETGLYTQLVAITHLPQIAAKASNHMKVLKQTHEGATNVSVFALGQVAREEELAEMLSGKNYTSAALENARELMRS